MEHCVNVNTGIDLSSSMRNFSPKASKPQNQSAYAPVGGDGGNGRPSCIIQLEVAQIGDRFEYTKEDAYTARACGTLQMDEAFVNERINALVAAADDAAGSHEADLSNATERLGKDLDSIASQYVVTKDYINATYNDEERAAQLDRLEKVTNASKQNAARYFADAVGGFLEKNGVSGERDRLYQSVLSEVDQKIVLYSEFSQSNQDYADINGPEEAWLKQDSAYMSSELRKAVAGAEMPETKSIQNSEGYTVDEMEKMCSFAKEMDSYSRYIPGSTKEVVTGQETEESLGLKLSELNLKAKLFSECSGVSDKVKDIVSKSADHFIASAIDKEQAYMEKWSQIQIQNTYELLREGRISQKKADEQIESIHRGFSAVDKNAIYAVINKVQSTYESTGSASKALLEGAVFALNSYVEKTQDGQYSGVHRYDKGARYWNNFFTNKDTFGSKYGPLGFERPFNGYIQKESGLDGMVNSWNAFMGKITSDSSVRLDKIHYSAYA